MRDILTRRLEKKPSEKDQEEIEKELLDQKKQNEEMKSVLGSMMTTAEPHKKPPGKIDAVSREDDATVMIRRR